MRRRLSQLRRDESGVVLVLVAGMMVMILAAAAIAIDVGSWYQTQKQVQNAADAAALAGAQDLPSSPATATTDAQSYVSKNITGASATVTTPYSGSSSEIMVRVTTTASTFFAGALGITAPKVGATAVAKNTSKAAPCVTPGASCLAIFAMDSSCGTTPVTLGGGDHVTGGVASNGSINVGGGGSSYGPTTYGNGSGCTVSPTGYQQQSNTFTSGPTAQAPLTSWPIDYTTDFPSCSGAACTGPGGTPSFCTQSTTATSTTLQNYTPVNLASGNIYCDVGSGTASTPSTWNGTLTVNQVGGTIEATYVAGKVIIGGGSNLEACGYSSSGYSSSGCSGSVPTPSTTNYPLIYATGSGTAIDESSGGGTFQGDMFAPNGLITIGGGSGTVFLEGYDVNASSGALTATGDGPAYSGGSSSILSTSLIQ